MSDNDNTIEARLVEASEQLVASFSQLDTEAELRAVAAARCRRAERTRTGGGPVGSPSRQLSRWSPAAQLRSR